MYRSCSYIIETVIIIKTIFGYMYGTCTFFFPTCSDQVQTKLALGKDPAEKATAGRHRGVVRARRAAAAGESESAGYARPSQAVRRLEISGGSTRADA